MPGPLKIRLCVINRQRPESNQEKPYLYFVVTLAIIYLAPILSPNPPSRSHARLPAPRLSPPSEGGTSPPKQKMNASRLLHTCWRGRSLHCTGSRLRPPAGGWRTGSSLAWATSTQHGPPTGSWFWPAAGGRACGMLSRTTSLWPGPPTGSRPCLLPAGDTCSSAYAEVLLYAGRRPAAGSGWLRVVVRSLRLLARQPHCPASPPHPPRGSRSHTCCFRQDPTPLG
jgi:hypothetical protein